MTMKRGTQGRKRTLNAPTHLGTFWGTYTRRQTQPHGVRRKSSRCFSQEKWSDRARRNQTQNALENLKTAVREHIGVRVPGPPSLINNDLRQPASGPPVLFGHSTGHKQQGLDHDQSLRCTPRPPSQDVAICLFGKHRPT